MSESISLRPVTAEEDEFLYALYASTRMDEVAAFGWNEVQAEAFLRMQFGLRQQAYRMQFPGADDTVILLNGKPVGRLIIERRDHEMVITDIAILPQYRKKGIGSQLIHELKSEVSGSAKPLVLRVDKSNIAAKAFYEKAGFAVIGDTDIVWAMECRP